MSDEKDFDVNEKFVPNKKVLDIPISQNQLDDALDILNIDNFSDEESYLLVTTHILQQAARTNTPISIQEVEDKIKAHLVDRISTLLQKSGLAEFSIDSNGETFGVLTEEGKRYLDENNVQEG